MQQPGLINDDAVATRAFRAGFQAMAEYDRLGRLIATRGALSSPFAWVRVGHLIITGQRPVAAEAATGILLEDLFVAALALEGGGTLLAIVEQPVVGEAANELARKLDSAVAGFLGPVVAPWVVLGALVLLTLYLGHRSGALRF